MGLVNTGIKVPHVYNEIYCCIFDVVGLYFCWRSWTSCLDIWHHGSYQNPTNKKSTNDWLFEILLWAMFGSSNRKIIQTQNLKTTQKWVTEHKTELLLWPFKSSDMNPVEDEWGELKRRNTTLVRCYLTSSGIIGEHLELLNLQMEVSKSIE